MPMLSREIPGPAIPTGAGTVRPVAPATLVQLGGRRGRIEAGYLRPAHVDVVTPEGVATRMRTAQAGPVAVIEIGPRGVQVRPVIDYTRIGVTVVLGLLGVWRAGRRR